MDLANVLESVSGSNRICVGIFGANGIDASNLIVSLVHWLYLGIQVLVPILLIIFGMIELAKAITAQKEDEIKKAQTGLFKKVILAVIVFLVFSIVSLVMGIVGADKEDGNSGGVWTCAQHFINGK